MYDEVSNVFDWRAVYVWLKISYRKSAGHVGRHMCVFLILLDVTRWLKFPS